MMLQVIARNEPLEPSRRRLFERRVNYVLGKFGVEVLAARVIFEDHNGPRGGFDQECRIEVQTRRGALLVASVIDETPDQALDRALRRIHRRLRGMLDRRRGWSRTVVNEVLALPETTATPQEAGEPADSRERTPALRSWAGMRP